MFYLKAEEEIYHQGKYTIYVAGGTMHTKVFRHIIKARTLFDQEVAQITNSKHSCSSTIAATISLPKQKRKVHLGAVQHADRTSLDLRTIP